jgi:hypothetical protein
LTAAYKVSTVLAARFERPEERLMAIATQTMTREQRKSVALEYFKRFDHGGDVLGLFAEDADVYFPKYLDPDYAGADTERYHWLVQAVSLPPGHEER